MQPHKHSVGHSTGVLVPKDLINAFKQEAEAIMSHSPAEWVKDLYLECGLDKPDSDYGKEQFIKGYVFTRSLLYKQNNGVPPIPFPVSFSTVDVGAVAFHENELYLLLGRKPGQTVFQFPGGFRDPKETNAQAASRELNEEASLDFDSKKFEYIDQLFIDDIRYRDSCHKVTTTLFMLMVTYEQLSSYKAADDLEEVKLFKLNDLIKDPSIIRHIHTQLFEMLWQYILSVPDQSKYITPKHVVDSILK